MYTIIGTNQGNYFAIVISPVTEVTTTTDSVLFKTKEAAIERACVLAQKVSRSVMLNTTTGVELQQPCYIGIAPCEVIAFYVKGELVK